MCKHGWFSIVGNGGHDVDSDDQVMMAIMISSMVFEDDFGDNICEDSSIMTMMVFKMMLVTMF